MEKCYCGANKLGGGSDFSGAVMNESIFQNLNYKLQKRLSHVLSIHQSHQKWSNKFF